jgi:hypothetical protein
MHDEVMNAIAIVARTNAYFIGNRNKQALLGMSRLPKLGYQGAGILS